MQAIPRSLEEYRRLPYTLRLEPSPDSDSKKYWIASYLELPGCKIDGETEAQAVENLFSLFDDYIVTMIENGEEIPIPRHEYGRVWPTLITTTIAIEQGDAPDTEEETESTAGEGVRELRGSMT